MPSAAVIRKTALSAFLMLATALVSGYATFAIVAKWRTARASAIADSTASQLSDSARTEAMFPSGDYLVAFVLVSANCGFSAEGHTRAALSAMRTRLRAVGKGRFVAVKVVGVSIDDSLAEGIAFLQSIQQDGGAFDEIAVGGIWLNELVASLVWKQGLTGAGVPSVLLVQRKVNSRGYPASIEVSSDSVLKRVSGRDSIIAWVARGTPL